ncbi:hypothetical protein TNCV_3598781 [Trichonephila clavipes]|nr:hypothetical protein TNCV_3598781 [Trichonephila clavipes]
MECNAEDCGFQMLNVDAIVTFVQEESDTVDDETDEDEDNSESSKGPSNVDMFSALEIAMEWFEQQSECCPTQLLLLKRIRYLVAKKRRCTMVQRKISKTPMEILKMLSKVYCESTMARFKDYEWHRRFKEGRESIKYNERDGRPTTSRKTENVALVAECVRNDRR